MDSERAEGRARGRVDRCRKGENQKLRGRMRPQVGRKQGTKTDAMMCILSKIGVFQSENRKNMDNGYKTWMCLICGWVYDEEQGAPDEGLAPGTRWQDVPINWTCPECGARKEDFELTEI